MRIGIIVKETRAIYYSNEHWRECTHLASKSGRAGKQRYLLPDSLLILLLGRSSFLLKPRANIANGVLDSVIIQKIGTVANIDYGQRYTLWTDAFSFEMRGDALLARQ